MNTPPAPTIILREGCSTVEAREAIASLLGDELGPLTRLHNSRRLAELLPFVALWTVGAWAIADTVGEPLRWTSVALCGAGTFAVAIAVNAFVLLLHEGMHGTFLFRQGDRRQRHAVLIDYAILALVYLTLVAIVDHRLLLHVGLIPAILVGFMVNLRGFSQHGITRTDDALLASRSLKPQLLVERCLLGENYHLEHHLFPEVPSYHLAKLHDLVWPLLPRVVTGTSYRGFFFRFVRATLKQDDTPIGLEMRSSSRETTP